MKKLSLLATFAVLALGSCSNDQEFENTSTSGVGNEINFRTFVDKGAASRATITNGNNITSFTVTGWWDKNSDGAAAISSATVDQYLFNGLNITRAEGGAGSGWSYATRYWPTTGGDVYFYAYSPASTANVTRGLKNYKGTKIAYTVPDPSATEPQEDFLLANPGSKKTGTVDVTFAHTLSRVKFFAKTTDTGITTSIGGIELLNINKSGEIDFASIPTTGVFSYNDASATNTNQVILWDTHDNKGNLKLDMGTADALLTGEYKSIGGETNALMVLPQKTVLGDVSSETAINTSVSSGKFLIKVLYKAVDYGMGRWYAGSPTTYEVKYFAVKDIHRAGQPHSFEIGRQYNFYLSFDEVGDPIIFDPVVGDWDDKYNSIVVPEILDYRNLLSVKIAQILESDNTKPIPYAKILSTTDLTLGDGSTPLTQADFKGLEYFDNMTELTVYKTDGNVDLNLTGLTKLHTLELHKEANFASINIANIVTRLSFHLYSDTTEGEYNILVNNLIVWDGFQVATANNKLYIYPDRSFYGTPYHGGIKVEAVTPVNGGTSSVSKMWVGYGSDTSAAYDYTTDKAYE